MPKELIPRCRNGHDLSLLGRNRDGHCLACRKERDQQRKVSRRMQVAIGGTVDHPYQLGSGWTYSAVGFQWNKETLDTGGKLRAIAQYHAERESTATLPAILAIEYLDATGARNGLDYRYDTDPWGSVRDYMAAGDTRQEAYESVVIDARWNKPRWGLPDYEGNREADLEKAR